MLADITPICRRASEMLSSWLPLQLPSYLFCLTDFKHQQFSCVMTSLIAKQGIVTYLSSPSMFPDTTSVLSHNGQYILCDYSVPITLHTVKPYCNVFVGWSNFSSSKAIQVTLSSNTYIVTCTHTGIIVLLFLISRQMGLHCHLLLHGYCS